MLLQKLFFFITLHIFIIIETTINIKLNRHHKISVSFIATVIINDKYKICIFTKMFFETGFFKGEILSII